MYCPAQDVYWREEAEVILLIGPVGGFRLTGPVADCWRQLAGQGERGEIEAGALRSLLEAKLIVEANDSERWQRNNLQHLPSSVGARAELAALGPSGAAGG